MLEDKIKDIEKMISDDLNIHQQRTVAAEHDKIKLTRDLSGCFNYCFFEFSCFVVFAIIVLFFC